MTSSEPFDGKPTSGPPGRETGRAGGARSVLQGVPAPWVLAVAGLIATAVWHNGSPLHSPIAPAPLHLHTTPPKPPRVTETVSVLLAARHDHETTVTAICAALGQLDVDQLDVVVLDYGCRPDTRSALRAEFGDDSRLRILGAAPLPRGWCPTAHRAHQLAVAARGQVMLFTEPTAPLGRLAAASATALLRHEGLDLAVLDSGRPMAGDAASGHAWLYRPRPGRFTVAVDTAAYWRVGGYRATAASGDPLALLRTIRRANGRTAIADGRRVIPPAMLRGPLPFAEAEFPAGGHDGDGSRTGRSSFTDSARKMVAALVSGRV